MNLSQIRFKFGKFIILTSSIFFSFFMAGLAQRNWSPADDSDVPIAVQNELKKICSNISNLRWGMRYKGRHLIYHATGSDSGTAFSATFDDKGQVIGYLKKLNDGEVPEIVSKDMKQTELHGYKLQGASRKFSPKGNTYKVYYINESGKRIKKVYTEPSGEFKKLNSK